MKLRSKKSRFLFRQKSYCYQPFLFQKLHKLKDENKMLKDKLQFLEDASVSIIVWCRLQFTHWKKKNSLNNNRKIKVQVIKINTVFFAA